MDIRNAMTVVDGKLVALCDVVLNAREGEKWMKRYSRLTPEQLLGGIDVVSDHVLLDRLTDLANDIAQVQHTIFMSEQIGVPDMKGHDQVAELRDRYTATLSEIKDRTLNMPEELCDHPAHETDKMKKMVEDFIAVYKPLIDTQARNHTLDSLNTAYMALEREDGDYSNDDVNVRGAIRSEIRKLARSIIGE